MSSCLLRHATVTDGHGTTPRCVAQPATHNAWGLVRRQSASVKTADGRCSPKRPKLTSFSATSQVLQRNIGARISGMPNPIYKSYWPKAASNGDPIYTKTIYVTEKP
jgi:hypothetical protein